MITRLRVRNFKSLRDVDIRLGPLNVLVGPNMSGKSNLVDVFRFLFEAVYPTPGADGVLNALATRGGMNEVLWKGSDQKLLAISLEGTRNSTARESYRYDLEIILGASDFAYVQKELLKVRRGEQEFDLIIEDGRERWLTNADGSRVATVTSSSKSAFERAPRNWDGLPFADSVATWRFYQFVPAIMKTRNQVGTGRVLEAHGANISAWLMGLQTQYEDQFAKITQAMRDVFPTIRSILTRPSEQGLVHIASHEHGLKRPVNVWQMSDGELAFLALLSLIYSPPELGAYLYCIEEPENHLHPRLLATLVALTRQVRQAISDSGQELAQIIVTTQSPHLVDQMSLDEVIWLERKGAETLAIKPANQEQLRKLIEDKELGLGDIVYSGILSEGE